MPEQFTERAYRLRDDGKALVYQYFECVKHFIWCQKWEKRIIVEDLSDPATVRKFIDGDWVFEVREKP